MILLEKLPYFQNIDLNNSELLLGMDFNHKGLEKLDPTIEVGGRKAKQQFLIPEQLMDSPTDFRTAIEIEFTDVLEIGELIAISATVKIFNENSTVLFEKTEIQKIKSVEKFLRARYDRAYTHLKQSAKGTPIEGMVNTILSYYQSEVSMWLLGNPQEFLDSINNETDTTMNGYLQTVVHVSGKKVIDGITEQLTGIKWTP